MEKLMRTFSLILKKRHSGIIPLASVEKTPIL